MSASKIDPASVPAPQEGPAADCPPMIQQDTRDAHGHDMHPQKLVRLVGCHDASVRKGHDVMDARSRSR